VEAQVQNIQEGRLGFCCRLTRGLCMSQARKKGNTTFCYGTYGGVALLVINVQFFLVLCALPLPLPLSRPEEDFGIRDPCYPTPFLSMASSWSHVCNILSPRLPIGHTFGIFSGPGFLLITRYTPACYKCPCVF
jgi:hypothetical protein